MTKFLVLAVGTIQGGPIRIDDQTFHTDAKSRRMVATLDLEGLNLLESETGAFVASVTVDDADVGRIQRQVQSHLQRVRQEDETARWKDQGYWLVFPVALLGLLWFRKGVDGSMATGSVSVHIGRVLTLRIPGYSFS